ncbi:histidine-rich glycoprotein-like [Teleopsis dalmanni]|uniref:histidine-rich glycoprotein-like n=1 Tax=Teleopsis dalmanni TaxID=139649 RepID=UPI0018CFA6EE|nr:histidine-rich glycoprotein-like [Teleopsis dalmanni]XP_037945831.1 histidine-rich glycoprotein-like [Teleopsis dalmanni]
MLKSMLLLLLSAFLAFASARPGFLHDHHHIDYPLLHHEPLHIAKYVHVPAAVSHQSSTVIHTAPHHIVKPIVLPVVKHVVHPIIKTYHPAPIIKAYHPLPLHLDHHAYHHDFHHYHH